jgi:hypothetical protein
MASIHGSRRNKFTISYHILPSSQEKKTLHLQNTVDGRNPAPVGTIGKLAT